MIKKVEININIICGKTCNDKLFRTMLLVMYSFNMTNIMLDIIEKIYLLILNSVFVLSKIKCIANIINIRKSNIHWMINMPSILADNPINDTYFSTWNSAYSYKKHNFIPKIPIVVNKTNNNDILAII